MPEDKRPRPTIDIPQDPARQASGQTAYRASGGPQSPRPANASGPARGRGTGLLGYALAGLIGGAAVAAGGYLALNGTVPGVSFDDAQARHRIKELEDRSVAVESKLRALAAQGTGFSSSGPAPGP